MRPFRFLIPLLVLAAALVVALIRPLPSHAGATVARTSPKKQPTKRQLRRRRHLASMQPVSTPPFGKRVVHYARRFLGVPYSWGGSSPRSGFDCSGFVRYVYAHFGISLPHSSFADLMRGRRIPRRFLRPGDLVFFYGASHVGIYVGGDRMIDAPHTGSVVRITTMRWFGSYDGARRLHRYTAR